MAFVENNMEKLAAMFPDILSDSTRPAKKRRQSNPMRSPDYWATPLGLLMKDPRTEYINTRQGRMFRRRFRVPYKFFKDFLVPKCREKNIFDHKRNKNGTLRETAIPIEFKILIGLRILGRGNCADDMTEMSGVGESTVNTIFKQFVFGFSKASFDSFVHMPHGEDLAQVMEVYKRLGRFNGLHTCKLDKVSRWI